jgi:hypothetical protein
MAAEVRFTQNFEDNLGTIQEFLLARSPATAVTSSLRCFKRSLPLRRCFPGTPVSAG